MERDTHTQVRFSGTPPDSPKSCMKGSRRINFADTSEVSSSGGGGDGAAAASSSSTSASASTSSPKRSTKTVVIKSPGTSTVESSSSSSSRHHHEESTAATASTSTSTATKPPGEIQFQFHLSQHYEQSTPPPNCTSNGDSFMDNDSSSSSPVASSSSNNNYRTSGDPELVEIASKFVNEIIEKAKLEATARQKATSTESERRQSLSGVRGDFVAAGRNLYRRAHGTISKWVTNLCVRAQNSMRT